MKRGTAPKSRANGLALRLAPTPAPRREMLNDPVLLALSEVVVKVPVAVGEKVKKYWQLPPGATAGTQFWVAEKGG